jgi:hypothetical protein
VADLDRHLQLVGELLQLDLPQASAHIVGAAAVRRDRQLTHIERWRPIRAIQVRIEVTANSAVSWVMPKCRRKARRQ